MAQFYFTRLHGQTNAPTGSRTEHESEKEDTWLSSLNGSSSLSSISNWVAEVHTAYLFAQILRKPTLRTVPQCVNLQVRLQQPCIPVATEESLEGTLPSLFGQSLQDCLFGFPALRPVRQFRRCGMVSQLHIASFLGVPREV